jgi:two-component system sensor histidine kinase/response regulator
VTMPEMDGYDVCAQFKGIEALREIPIIFLTALSSTADKIKAFEAGGADYITKPFQVDEVLARVRVHVALRQSRVQLVDSLERLRGLERLRDDLVQMVVHDMRSPLSALIMLIDLVRQDASCKLSDEAAEDLQAAVQAAASVNRMANDLLDVSRLEEGKLPLDRKPHDVLVIAREVVTQLAPLDVTRTIVVESTLPVEVSCDRNVVRRVLENLVGNAIKHTPAGGRITVTVTAHEGQARVCVRDEGAGVPVEIRSKIFEKFGTAEVRGDRKYHSAGLGLTFCKLAIEAHGGRIGVESGEPRGAVFWFELAR